MRTAALMLAMLFVAASAGTAARAGETAPLWEIGIGAAALHFPDYRGADQSRNYLLPLPYVIYRGKRLRVDREGIRGLLFRSERAVLDISADGAVPVNSNDNRARSGMPNLYPTVELGPSLDFRLNTSGDRTLRLRLPLRAVIATNLRHFHHAGWLFNPNLNLSWRGRWETSVALGPLFATRAYHDYYYSVPAAFATATRPAYSAHGGYSGMRLTLTASRRIHRYWIGAFLRYDDLSGAEFIDSPLVKRNSALMGGIGIAYVFDQSTVRVPVGDDEVRP